MAGYHVNQIATRSQPRQAAVGQLNDGVGIDEVATALERIGIDSDRIYFLVGQEGADTLDSARGFLSVFDDVIDRPLAALRQGHSVVGVFGVDKDDAPAVRRCLIDAGVSNTHYFGKWTHS